jgi:hypothetical protein
VTTAAAHRDEGTLAGALGRVATIFLLGVVPVVCAAFFLVASYAHESLGYDFRHAYLPAAEDVLDGDSPYVDVDDPRLATETAYVYPPPLALAVTPLTWLSENAASVVYTLLCAVVAAWALLLLGVRDWRCYTVALVWAPTLIGLQTASSSLLLLFAVALAWQFRDRAARAGVSLGGGVALKLLIWPLLGWTLATRRFATTVIAPAVAFSVILGSWAILEFEDLTRYPDLLRRLADLEAENSYSVIGVASALGIGEDAGKALAVVLGLALLLTCLFQGRRGDDLRSFLAALAAALAFTPIVWQHYLVLFLVPLAVVRPRLSPIWLLPVVLWLAPREDNGQAAQTVLPLLVAAVLLIFLWSAAPRVRSAPAPPEAAIPVPRA